ncbi:peptidase C15 [Methylobacterium sp. Leaf123]|uniref:pyroglutamyl-peptidase I family protein n=1 Tax=Methylobacterium sp. Leaf123 TaxID=1736264 RepID=UPI0006F7082E|nr:peptidase C15 [Methylobacterium sp. Leaf123]KQQ13592.1 peptidase C15 [Methylobacterium sp. Leaf123]
MSRLLITGFGPFPTVPDNPSARLARRLAAFPHLRRVLGHTPDCLVLDTRYDALHTQLAPALARGPSAVLMIGVAARRPRVCVETRAVNRVSRLFPDASGAVGCFLAFDPDGPAQRPSAAATQVRVALRRVGLDAAASRDAGRYLCNASYYRALATGRPVVFLHIPMPPRTQRPTAGGGRRRPALDLWADALIEAARVLALLGRAQR